MDSEFLNYEIIQHLKNNCSYFWGNIQELYHVCDDMLSLIPKTFSNYTLHDIGHSVRVIGYMNDLIKNNLIEFSELHLAIVVYVGLLHDVGMVVSEDEKCKLYQEFENKNSDFASLSENNKNNFLQDFVRKNHGIRVKNALKHEINPSMTISGLLYEGETKSYDLSELIAQICQSHNENCEWIFKNLPKEKFYGKYEINPQHIAFLLRIADALDIDDRRAPYLLYKLLNPQGLSDNEWRKHIPITNYKKIFYVDNMYELSFNGECAEHNIYRKIIEYIDWLNNDFNEIVEISKNFINPYKLNLVLPIKESIGTLGFVQTKLKFSLEYRQISQLLMGEHIYGDKKAGLRELLQNSIDAVFLMKDICLKNPYSSYTPLVVVEINKCKNQIVIFDNGIGMSDEILTKYFFNIGSSYYMSDEFVNEEYCYKPIGHFGIGFLACFMLSSTVTLETKSYKTKELIKMSFDKESPYVTKMDVKDNGQFDSGTKIIMEYNQVIPNAFSIEKDIKKYIESNLITEGLCFRLINNGCNEEIMVHKPEKFESFENDIIEYEYDISPDLNVKFDILNFWKENENVYFVEDDFNDWEFDEGPFISLGLLKENISDLEVNLQTNEQINKINFNDILINNSFFDDIYYASAFQEFIFSNEGKINKYYLKNKNIYGFCRDYFTQKYIDNNRLVWYDIPVILNKNLFNSFLINLEENQEVAFKRYENEIKYIPILCKDGYISDDLIMDIVKRFVDIHDIGEDTIDVSYYTTYPIKPIEKSLSLLGIPNSHNYINIIQNSHKLNLVYLNGIRILDNNINIPYEIDGIDINRTYINIKSSKYDTDISRSYFSLHSREKIIKIVMNIIYEDLIKSNDMDKEEIELIRYFLNNYYSNN